MNGFMGHYAPAGGFSSMDVAVCTIEKGNGLINRLLEENKLDKLGKIWVSQLVGLWGIMPLLVISAA